jgi:glycerol-3-phosphate acyltransferase PlsY
MLNMLGWILMIVGYLSGSLCSAIIVCRVCGLPDPREDGSKNPGSTNVLRLHGKKYAAMVFVGDVLKGTIPVVIGHLLGLSSVWLAWISLFCVLGHLYPVFFKFKGGKGVATALGCFLGINWLFGLICLLVWLLTVLAKRYSSLASIVMISSAPFIAILELHHEDIFLPLFVLTIVVLYKHKDNITRLIRGEETKIKF